MATSAGARLILANKIIDALTRMGYDEGDCEKVQKLVESNAGTALFDSSSDKSSDAPVTIDEVLQNMHSHLIRVNSNEPVLLINKADGNSNVEDMADDTLRELHAKWNIKPVRIYAGSYAKGESSITVLNVVNTDIGGPSMIQLLDYPSEDPVWNGCELKEVWNNGSFVSRESRNPRPEVLAQPASTINHPAESPLEDTSVIGDEAKADDITMGESEPTEKEESGLASPEGSDHEDFFDVSKSTEHADIKHPTWSREDEHESLYDLIGRHSGRLATPESIPDVDVPRKEVATHSITREIEQSKAAPEPSVASDAKEVVDEDGFEMVKT